MVQLLIAIVLGSTMVASLPFDDDNDNSDFTVDYELPDFLTVSSSILGNLTRPGAVSASLISASSSDGLQADLVKGLYYLTQFGYIQPSNSSAFRQANWFSPISQIALVIPFIYCISERIIFLIAFTV
jgi:hypothetical protein